MALPENMFTSTQDLLYVEEKNLIKNKLSLKVLECIRKLSKGEILPITWA